MMNFTKRALAAQLLLIFPALLFMSSLVVRELGPLSSEPARTAQQIVMWYAGRQWTLWVLLFALPGAVLVTGCLTLLSSVGSELETKQTARRMWAVLHAQRTMQFVAGTTATAGAVLSIVVLHMMAN